MLIIRLCRISLCLFFLCLMGSYSVIPCHAKLNPLEVTVSILPQKFFVHKIGGKAVLVNVMVPPGFSPATYEPTPNQLRQILDSKIYFAIGVPFEKVWLDKFSSLNPGMLIVHTEKGSKCKNDPHIWLSPPLVKKQARIIAKAFIKVDPIHKKRYEDNLKAFEKELTDLDKRIRNIFANIGRKKEFLVLHPAWGYFAAQYGLKQISINREGKEPSAKALARLISYVKKKGFKVIIVQPQFSRKKAEAIAKEIGGKIVFADPLEEDWEKNIEDMALKIKMALQ